MNIILAALFSINNFDLINFYNIKVAVNNDVSNNIISRKVNNLLKAKNIKKLTNFKKSYFVKIKANRVFGTGFITLKAKVVFI